MSGLSRKVNRLQRRNSQGHVFLLFLTLVAALGIALAARLYAVAPVKIMDSSMTPLFKEQSIHWMCKLPRCLDRIVDQDIAWVALRNGETMVRKVLAMPGDTIEITDKGKVRTPHRNFKWKDEDAFIQSRTIYVPKAGDTLLFDELNDVEQDYVISYLHGRGEKVAVKSTLWQGDREINLDRVGSTKIANRQVSLNEINYLPWQDRYLIELQIRQSEPGNSPIKIKRKLFKLKDQKIELTPPMPADSTDANSVAPKDSVPFNTSVAAAHEPPPATVEKKEEVYDEPLNEIVIKDDCYFLVCAKGNNCPDSREIGYFTRKDFIGRYVERPDRIKNKVIDPVVRYAKKAIDYILSMALPNKNEDENP